MMPKKAPDPALKKIVVPSRTDIIETHLKDYFKQQQFSAGDAIPPETELAQTLGVSRNAVREALSRFRMLGIVETKTRTGMVLGQPDIAQAIEKVVDLMVLSESSKKELFEIRIALEIGIADFVFMQQTPEQIAVLEEIVDRETSAQTDEERIQCDIDFHSQLFKMTNNATFIGFQKILRPVFKDVLENLYAYKQKDWKRIVKHHELLNILKEGTPDDFRKAMREHMKPHIERLKDIQ